MQVSSFSGALFWAPGLLSWVATRIFFLHKEGRNNHIKNLAILTSPNEQASSPFKGGAGEDRPRERFNCSSCSKSYSFLHKLQHHQLWSCKTKEHQEQIDTARRPLSSNVFSFSAKGIDGEVDGNIVSRKDASKQVHLYFGTLLLTQTFRWLDASSAPSFFQARVQCVGTQRHSTKLGCSIVRYFWTRFQVLF